MTSTRWADLALGETLLLVGSAISEVFLGTSHSVGVTYSRFNNWVNKCNKKWTIIARTTCVDLRKREDMLAKARIMFAMRKCIVCKKQTSSGKNNPRMIATLNNNVATMLHNARTKKNQSLKLLSMLKHNQKNVETSNLISNLASKMELRMLDGEI